MRARLYLPQHGDEGGSVGEADGEGDEPEGQQGHDSRHRQGQGCGERQGERSSEESGDRVRHSRGQRYERTFQGMGGLTYAIKTGLQVP